MTAARCVPSVGFLGCGNMAGAILTRIVEQGVVAREDAYASARTRATLDRLDGILPEENLLIGTDANRKLVLQCDWIVLGVKPQMAAAVLADISPAFHPERHVIISLLAGVSAEKQAAALCCDGARIVRAIPSMAASVGQSCTVMVAGANARADDVDSALMFLEACGSVEILPSESMIDVATAAALPTFAYLALEAIADAAVLEGLPRGVAQRLAAKSLQSAAALAASAADVHPAALRNAAESPAGVTIRATRELERGGYRAAIMNAMAAATARSIELNT
jgi:pyrroline-5-carboxylate reductase